MDEAKQNKKSRGFTDKDIDKEKRLLDKKGKGGKLFKDEETFLQDMAMKKANEKRDKDLGFVKTDQDLIDEKRAKALKSRKGKGISKADKEFLEIFNDKDAQRGKAGVAKENLKQLDLKAVFEKQADLDLKILEIQKKQTELSAGG